MTRNEWVVRSVSFLEGINTPFSQTEITVETRSAARILMGAQKELAKHAILRTEVHMYRVKTVELFAGTSITRFYTKVR